MNKEIDTNIDIAIIGNEDTILLFNTVGVKTFFCTDPIEIDKIIFDLAKKSCKIIFVSEKIYKIIPDTLDKYLTLAYPIILPIPTEELSNQSGESLGLKRIKASVEKAIGISIF